MGRFSLIPDKKQKAGAKNVCLLYYHFEIVSSLIRLKHRAVFHNEAPLCIVRNLLGCASVPDDDGRQCSVCAATNANVHVVLNAPHTD